MKNSIKSVYSFCMKNVLYFIASWILIYGAITSINSNSIPWYNVLYFGILLVTLCVAIYVENKKPQYAPMAKIVLYLMMTIALAILFFSTTEMIKAVRNVLFDEQLTRGDTLLFPFWKNGQLGIMIDSNELLNPSTTLGKFLNDAFEIFYISYYLWGYLSFGICAFEVFFQWIKCFRIQKHQNGQNVIEMETEKYELDSDVSTKQTTSVNQKKLEQKIINMEYLMIHFATTFCLVFILNLFVPGKSPRLYLRDEYENEITGFGFTKWWKAHVDQDDSAGTFPSGHCGETFAIAFGIFYSHKKFGILVFIMGILVSAATLWNRYHYFVDLLTGILCCLCSYTLANLYLREKVKN